MVMRSVQPCAALSCAACGLFSQVVFEMALAKKKEKKNETKQFRNFSGLPFDCSFCFVVRQPSTPNGRIEKEESIDHHITHRKWYVDSVTSRDPSPLAHPAPKRNCFSPLLCCRIQFSTPYRPFPTRPSSGALQSQRRCTCGAEGCATFRNSLADDLFALLTGSLRMCVRRRQRAVRCSSSSTIV